VLEQFQPVIREELKHGNLAHLAPIRAIGSEAKHGIVVGHDFGADRLWSTRKGSIIHCKALLGYLPIANYQCSMNAGLDGEDRPVLVSHAC